METMENQDKILKEIKSLKGLVSRLMGSSNPTASIPFKKESLDKAAKEFEKLSIKRGQWIDSYDIQKVIRTAPYDSGKFIREHFHFKNCFKRGRVYYYYKQDLILLAKELKKRKIHLERYMHFIEDQEKFNSYLEAILNGSQKPKKRGFKIPPYLKDIESTPPKIPPVEVLMEELSGLKKEYHELKLAEYIDIYKGNYAFAKNIWRIEKYVDPEIKKRIRKWPDEFNLVNELITEVTQKKEIFIPIPSE